ncbi:700_t:CDS:2 [Ambispora gerdemannii]|uniref:700_t:CDS:1 n=1 Tax=Ambispora gerdemannii TaxID=144530 RepID=A0A9N9BZ35_9GLOM|nr:700_t:CDS:2 [Ambispora gerdemannii]
MGPRLPVVCLVRHGETEWSKNGRHTSITEVELTSHGRTQARDLSRFVFENPCQDFIDPTNITQIYVSPRRRAQQTLELVTLPNKSAIPTITEPNLTEWDYGDYEGITTHEIHSNTYAFWDLWRDGCPNGETIEHVSNRCDRVIAKLHMEHNPTGPGGDILVVGHSHLLRVLVMRWLNLPASHGRHVVLDTAFKCTWI